MPVIARRASKSGHSPDGPDFGGARPAWGTVPECNTGTPFHKSEAFPHPT